MPQESRVKKSLLNARVNLIFYFLTLVLSFFSRKIFLDCLGADFIGLTTTVGDLLRFLNLAEMGVGMAVGYALYKPLYNDDKKSINEIISVFGYLYQKIGFIILIAGIILSLFIPLIFKGVGFSFFLIYFAFYSFLTSSLIGYFFNYKQTLLGADQKNYVITGYLQTSSIIKTIIQLVLAYYFHNYYYWIATELIFACIFSYILNWKIRKTYPWLDSVKENGPLLLGKYKNIIKYTKQLFVHLLSAVAQYQTNNILIYFFSSVTTVALYGNYIIITDKISQLINNVYSSTTAAVGNLIAEGNNEKAQNVFFELVTLRYFIAALVVVGIYTFIEPFIIFWIGEKYILNRSILFLILLYFFIDSTHGEVLDQFVRGYGLFQDTWAAIGSVLAKLVFSISLGFIWGINGVLLGNIIATFLYRVIWKPYFLYRNGFKSSPLKYRLLSLKYILFIIISFIPSFLVKDLFLSGTHEHITLSSISSNLFTFFFYTSILTTLFYFFTKYSKTFMNKIIYSILKK